jgi:hypothetical protein
MDSVRSAISFSGAGSVFYTPHKAMYQTQCPGFAEAVAATQALRAVVAFLAAIVVGAALGRLAAALTPPAQREPGAFLV